MELAALLGELPTDHRLALSYAPARSRGPTAAVLVLDARLARIVGQRREPILAQMRLAWWRERLAGDPSQRGLGDPLLALLTDWQEIRDGLAALVDGWEALLAEPPLPDAAAVAFAHGRAQAFAALARQLGEEAHAGAAAKACAAWALAELAAKTHDPEEAASIRALAGQADWNRVALPRALRPLAVLHGLAARKKGCGPLLAGPGDGFAALRLGLLGR